MFLGGDPTRLVQMTTQQLFHHEQPFEVHKTPEDCDTHYSRPESPCGHLVMNPMNQTHCEGIKLNLHSSKLFSLLSSDDVITFFNKLYQVP